MSSTVSSRTVSPQEAVTTQLVWLDPKALVGNPANVRGDLRNLDELAESIAESGIVEPLVVVPLEDGHRILAGHRRAAAAVMAELDVVPCWVRTDLAEAESDQLATALIENMQRDDLTPLEEAHAYAQLAAFPTWSIERIASSTGRPTERVRRGVAALKLPERLQEPAVIGEVSFEEARQLESFSDDPSTYRRLLNHLGERNFPYLLAQAHRDREVAQEKASSRAELKEAGVPIVSRPSYSSVEIRLADLTDDEGERLDEADHASCPGHAAYVDDYSGKVGYVCREPKAHGHVTPSWYRHLSEEEAKARAAEEEAEQARAAELELAGEVRRSFVRQRIAAKGKPPAGTLRLVAELLLDDDARTGAMDDVAWYLGHDDPESIDVQDALATSLRKTSEPRLPLVLLAVAAAAAEDNLAACGSWRYSPAITLRWLNFVAGLGYSLSEAETSLVQAAHQPVDEADADGEAAP